MTEERAPYAVSATKGREVAATGIPGAEWLTPANLAQGMELAQMMAGTALVPDHLKKKPEDCFPILVQALRWRMDPFAVAQSTAMVRGKLCYEGKLVHAVLVSMGAIDGRLTYEYAGEGQKRQITVTGTPHGAKPCSISGTVAGWATDNQMWKKDADTMLAYRGTRVWARLYCPDAMLGVATPDEVTEEVPTREVEATVRDLEPQPAKVRSEPAKVQDSSPEQEDSSPTPAEEPAEEPMVEDEPAPYDLAQHALTQLWKAGGKGISKDILAGYGAKKLDEITDYKTLTNIAEDARTELAKLNEAARG